MIRREKNSSSDEVRERGIVGEGGGGWQDGWCRISLI